MDSVLGFNVFWILFLTRSHSAKSKPIKPGSMYLQYSQITVPDILFRMRFVACRTDTCKFPQVHKINYTKVKWTKIAVNVIPCCQIASLSYHALISRCSPKIGKYTYDTWSVRTRCLRSNERKSVCMVDNAANLNVQSLIYAGQLIFGVFCLLLAQISSNKSAASVLWYAHFPCGLICLCLLFPNVPPQDLNYLV